MKSKHTVPDRDSEEWDRTKEALAREARINRVMAELSSALILPAPLEDIAYLILERAKQLTGSRFGYVGYVDPYTGHLVCPTMTRDIWETCQVPDKTFTFETFGGLWGWVLENRQPLLTNDPDHDPRSTGVPGGHIAIRRFLSAPALIGETLVGQIALANAADDYGQQDLDIVERLASLYALAVQRKQAKEQVVSVLESISDAFFALDQDLVVTYFNRAAERLLGRKSEEMLGHPLFEAFPEAKGSIFEEKYTLALAEKKPLAFETYFGVAPYTNWYKVRVYPYQEGISVYFQVTTERKLAEEALQESEEKYRTLVEKSLQGVVIAQANPVRLSFANEPMEAICGYTPEELLRFTPDQLAGLVHLQDREAFFQNFQDRLADRDVEPRRAYRIIHRDGGVRWAETYSSRIEYEGTPATLTVFLDITERKRVEHALQQAEQRLDKMLQTMVDGMVVVDLEGRITYANQSAERILEIYRDEIVGRYYNEREWRQIDEERNPYPLAELPLAIALCEGREVQGLEHGILAPDGTAKWLSVNAAPLLNEQGQVYGAVASFRDITERKRADELLSRQAEELARSNAELEQFAYIASHDLQEPLRTVSSYMQLLDRCYGEQLDVEAQEYIVFAVDGVARMQDLIRDLLEYSQVDRLGQAPEPTDSEFIVGLVLDSLQMTVKEAGAMVTHDPLPTVMADSTQLGQVFQNLISNALKFRGEEPPRVHISAKATDSEWLFAVRDNGIGIEPQFQARIFDIFERLHTRDEYPGTGIGLALCTKIVERHGGRIWVDSQPGRGSTFWFSISRKGEAPYGTKSEP